MQRYRMYKTDPAWDASHGGTGGGTSPLPIIHVPSAPPMPLKDTATGAIDWQPVKTWVTAQMKDWPFARGALNEFIKLKGASILTQEDALKIAAMIASLEAIYQASQATMTDEQLGAFLVDELVFATDSIITVITRYAPQLTQYIPIFLMGGNLGGV